MKRILLSVAHPDDDFLNMGGTIAKYSKAGWDTTLLCLTRGEAGLSKEYSHLSSERRGQIREAELHESATLGISRVILLDYKDGTTAKR